METKTKTNYKLTPIQKADLMTYINVERSNQVVVEYINKKYDVGISPSYVSQIRKKMAFQQMDYMNKTLEKELTKKTRIKDNLLEVMDKAVVLLKKAVIQENLKPKEITEILNTVNRVYSETNSGSRGKESTMDAIRREAGM